ncbi:MAG: ykoG [Candidatus Saccharibacteria bacterium]|nr:ykoG [Candidatus Saccharibacteria bacterium]
MRILVVEDEPKIAAAIKRGLEQEAFSVDVVEDGDSGLSYGLSGDYDAIVLDWMLPGSIDGKAVCEELRKKGTKTPILMLTARDSVGAKVAGLNGGADDYLAKPFAFDELVARIHALLRRPAGLDQTKLSAGKLRLEPATKVVTYGAKSVRLTAKEFSLLEYLLRHKGRVVSKDELITHVWSDDDDILPNTVEVYVGYLRNKIDRPFKSTLVQTVRGFGYKIVA